MPSTAPNPLTLAPRVLGGLIALNQLAGFLILVMLLTSVLDAEWLLRALGAEPAGPGPILLGLRLIMVIGIAGTIASNRVLTRLRAIVATVRAGDPFLAVNAARLQDIAWAMLGLELLHLGVGLIQATLLAANPSIDLNWRFSFTPWLSILLLFVLSRVFADGTRMRDDLEGTV